MNGFQQENRIKTLGHGTLPEDAADKTLNIRFIHVI